MVKISSYNSYLCSTAVAFYFSYPTPIPIAMFRISSILISFIKEEMVHIPMNVNTSIYVQRLTNYNS